MGFQITLLPDLKIDIFQMPMFHSRKRHHIDTTNTQLSLPPPLVPGCTIVKQLHKGGYNVPNLSARVKNLLQGKNIELHILFTCQELFHNLGLY